MIVFQLVGSMFACGGAPTEAPGASARAPIEAKLETNQMTCFGNADCVVVDLDCCCGEAVVASNRGSAEAVAAAHKRPEAECKAVECPAEECEKPSVSCVDAKCVLDE